MAITIRKLQEQYGSEWGEHPDFPVEDWQQEVAADDTRKGYWEWVLIVQLHGELADWAREALRHLPNVVDRLVLEPAATKAASLMQVPPSGPGNGCEPGFIETARVILNRAGAWLSAPVLSMSAGVSTALKPSL